jgi:hypothetical protein
MWSICLHPTVPAHLLLLLRVRTGPRVRQTTPNRVHGVLLRLHFGVIANVDISCQSKPKFQLFNARMQPLSWVTWQ